jgi:hypothetical protein
MEQLTASVSCAAILLKLRSEPVGEEAVTFPSEDGPANSQNEHDKVSALQREFLFQKRGKKMALCSTVRIPSSAISVTGSLCPLGSNMILIHP